MIAFQIEPASLCLGVALAGLPLLIWLWVHHRHAKATIGGLQAQLQSEQSARTECERTLDGQRRSHAQRLDDLQAEHMLRLDSLRAEHAQQLAQLKDESAQALEQARSELSIVTFPFDSEHGDKGWVVDDRTAEVGYQYQMFIRGVPCFEPHKVVLHRLQKKEVNQDKVASLSRQVFDLLENVASKHPAMTVAKKFVPILR